VTESLEVDGDMMVPAPKPTSNCWAEAKLARRKNAKTTAVSETNFLKRNLLSVRCRR
jgi:hypothetical protein